MTIQKTTTASELWATEPVAWPMTFANTLEALDHNNTTGKGPGIGKLVKYWFEQLGLKPEPALRQVFMRAADIWDVEANPTLSHPYHNSNHTAHVLHAMGMFLDVMRMQGKPLLSKWALAGLLAAIAHDFDHAGRPNPTDLWGLNEIVAANRLDALFDDLQPNAAFDDSWRTGLRLALYVTEPKDGHKVLHDVFTALQMKTNVDVTTWPAALANLAQNYPPSHPIWGVAALLHDADLAFSAGVSLKALQLSAQRLTDENKKAGLQDDFTKRAAQQYFLEHVVGRFYTKPARQLATPNFDLIKSLILPKAKARPKVM